MKLLLEKQVIDEVTADTVSKVGDKVAKGNTLNASDVQIELLKQEISKNQNLIK